MQRGKNEKTCISVGKTTGLTTINEYPSLFGRVACMDEDVSANKALRLMTANDQEFVPECFLRSLPFRYSCVPYPFPLFFPSAP